MCLNTSPLCVCVCVCVYVYVYVCMRDYDLLMDRDYSTLITGLTCQRRWFWTFYSADWRYCTGYVCDPVLTFVPWFGLGLNCMPVSICHTKALSRHLHTTVSFHTMQNWNWLLNSRWIWVFLDVYKLHSWFRLYSLIHMCKSWSHRYGYI